MEAISSTEAECRSSPPSAFPLRRRGLGAASLTWGLAVLALLLAFASLLLGPADLTIPQVLGSLVSPHGTAGVIVQQIRFPRASLALIVGGALGASGAALQGLFRNPLAEPGVTGVTSAAGLGAVVAFYFGFAAAYPILLPVFAVLGALAAAVILYLLSRAGAGAVALVLGGVAIASSRHCADGAGALPVAEPVRHERDRGLDDGLAEGPHFSRCRFRCPAGGARDRAATHGSAGTGCAGAGRGRRAQPRDPCPWLAPPGGARRRARHGGSDGGRWCCEFRGLGRAASAAAVLRLRAGAADLAFCARGSRARHRRGHRRAADLAGREASPRRADGAAGRAVFRLAHPPHAEERHERRLVVPRSFGRLPQPPGAAGGQRHLFARQCHRPGRTQRRRKNHAVPRGAALARVAGGRNSRTRSSARQLDA